MVLSRKAANNEFYELSNNTSRVATEIHFYLENNPFGTKYNPVPTAKELAKQFLSIDISRPLKGLELYEILIPKKERKEGRQKQAVSRAIEKRDSLVSKLNAINYLNEEELEKLKNTLLRVSESARNKAYEQIY